jgi:type VI protein secretion system component VasK
LAKQQEKLAQRMKEEQPATGREPSKEAQQQKDIADGLQKLAASNENARSELFRKRAEEAARFAEETQRLQERQEQLNQLKDQRDQPVEKREQQLKEMIAKEQESIDRQTRELDQAQKESQTDEELDALIKQQERVRDAMQAVQEIALKTP